ncbi:hypothetical protein [Planococcus sp. YIM B11945]|uniref:hypothetical protein n=1 Tax=Planococcus sp. YIM B11945 TaxID=3435410 RepID=UPI003D7EA923
MNPKEIRELLFPLRKFLPTETSQYYTGKDEIKCLKVHFLKTTDTFNISDVATDFLWQFTSIDCAAFFIKNYLESDTSRYISFTIKPRS